MSATTSWWASQSATPRDIDTSRQASGPILSPPQTSFLTVAPDFDDLHDVHEAQYASSARHAHHSASASQYGPHAYRRPGDSVAPMPTPIQEIFRLTQLVLAMDSDLRAARQTADRRAEHLEDAIEERLTKMTRLLDAIDRANEAAAKERDDARKALTADANEREDVRKALEAAREHQAEAVRFREEAKADRQQAREERKSLSDQMTRMEGVLAAIQAGSPAGGLAQTPTLSFSDNGQIGCETASGSTHPLGTSNDTRDITGKRIDSIDPGFSQPTDLCQHSYNDPSHPADNYFHVANISLPPSRSTSHIVKKSKRRRPAALAAIFSDSEDREDQEEDGGEEEAQFPRASKRLLFPPRPDPMHQRADPLSKPASSRSARPKRSSFTITKKPSSTRVRKFYGRAWLASKCLGMSSGERKTPAEWPPKGPNTARGRLEEIVCDACKGRCHWSCAGLAEDQDMSDETWVCPDCLHQIKVDEMDRILIETVPQVACIRYNCILREKRAIDHKEGEEQMYFVDRIIGRRAIQVDAEGNRVFEYLVRWLGYALNECTWEPESNLIPHFVQWHKTFMDKARKSGVVLSFDVALLPEALACWHAETGDRVQKAAEVDELDEATNKAGKSEVDGDLDIGVSSSAQYADHVVDLEDDIDLGIVDGPQGL
ncbi:hypothetical protein IAU60_002254 [Kwoniella sp. DSM 27419]